MVIPSLQVGGMERVMTELAWYLCGKNDLNVTLLLYGKKPVVYYSIPHNLIIHKPKSRFNDIFRLFSTIGRLIYLRNTVRTINPDSILSFGEYWNSFVLLALYNLPNPVFISDRCSPGKKFSFFHSILRGWLYPKAHGIVAQTTVANKLYQQQFKNANIKVIGCGGAGSDNTSRAAD